MTQGIVRDLQVYVDTKLLSRPQTLFSPERTRAYQDLCRRSDAKTLTEAERTRLLALIQQRDEQNAERLPIAAELAKRHGISLREMMAEFGIKPD